MPSDPSVGRSEASPYSEQGETYDADLVADLEAKAAAWRGRPLAYLLTEAAERLKWLKVELEAMTTAAAMYQESNDRLRTRYAAGYAAGRKSATREEAPDA